MISFLKTVIYIPLYNFLVVLLNIVPNAGVAVVVLTLIIKVILFPSAKKMAITQVRMRKNDQELKQIQEKYKDDKQAQAVKVMEFYKKYDINPFSSFFISIIQIPIIYSIYRIFMTSGLPNIDTSLVYKFLPHPNNVSMMLLNLDISQKSIVLALIAAFSSYLQMHLSPMNAPTPTGSKDDLSKMMTNQMKYTLPIIVFLISWKISGVIAIYWITMNVAGLVQDYIIKKKYLRLEV